MALQRNVACLLVLLVIFIVEVPTQSVARSMTVGDMKAAHGHGGGGISIKLRQYHHVNSTYAKSNLTLEQRVEIAVKSSLARGQYFRSVIYNETSDFGDKVVFTSPLYSDQASYVMEISLGTPARTFVAIADTGSDLVWIQCATCQACFTQPDPIFDPLESSTYETLPCTGNTFCSAAAAFTQQPCSIDQTCLYTYPYGNELSSSATAGDLSSETLTLTTTSGSTQAIPDFVFGCSHESTVDKFSNVDGLVGLGQGELSLVSQLGSQFGNVFSYCLVDFYSASTTTSPLLLGSPGSLPLLYTPLITNSIQPTFYYVNVVGITVDGTPVQYPAGALQIGSDGSGGLILDSGTTLTLLDARVYTPFVNLLKSLITYPLVDGPSAGFDLCFSVAGVASPTVPSVVFQFENLDVELPANNVFLAVDNNNDVCLAFQSISGVSIFGNVAQQNFQVAYDRANSRVGFAATTC